MSKKRMISTDFWSDTRIDGLDPTEKLIYIYCFTNDKSSRSGCTEIPIKKISYETGIDRDMIVKILSRFESEGKVCYREGYLMVKNFIKYHFTGFESPEKRSKNNQFKSIVESIKTLPNSILTFAIVFIPEFVNIINNSEDLKSLRSLFVASSESIVPSTSSSTSSSTSTLTSSSKDILATPVKRRPDIDEIIETIKKRCTDLGVAYDKNSERMFAKHLCDAIEYGSFCDSLNKNRCQVAISVLDASVSIGYFKGACSGPKKIYQNYAEVYNLWRTGGKQSNKPQGVKAY